MKQWLVGSPAVHVANPCDKSTNEEVLGVVVQAGLAMAGTDRKRFYRYGDEQSRSETGEAATGRSVGNRTLANQAWSLNTGKNRCV